MKWFESHKIPGVRRLRKEEIKELSKLPWVVDQALSDESNEARVLPDGRVLRCYRFGRNVVLYPSREAFEQMLRRTKEVEAEVRSGGGRFDPAKELLPPLAEFIRDVDEHAKGLGKVLRIPDEALDRSVGSLDPVDKAVGRLRVAKRMTPEVFTPLTAYLGEVMRLVCDGRWGKLPATIKRRHPVYDPDEYAAFNAAEDPARRAASEVVDKALAEALARPDDRAAQRAWEEALKALEAVRRSATTRLPEIVRWDEYEERVDGHEREPVIWAHDRALVQPVAALVRTLTERSTYGSLRTAVDGGLARYLIKGKTSSAPA